MLLACLVWTQNMTCVSNGLYWPNVLFNFPQIYIQSVLFSTNVSLTYQMKARRKHFKMGGGGETYVYTCITLVMKMGENCMNKLTLKVIGLCHFCKGRRNKTEHRKGRTRPCDYKKLFVLNSAEHEISKLDKSNLINVLE